MSGPRRLLAASFAALLCALSFVRFGFGFEAVAACIFACVLVVLATIDLDRHILPNRILVPAIAVLAAVGVVHDPGLAGRRLLWGAGAFGVLLALALVHPAGLGMGDVKLVFFVGLGLGRNVIPAMLLASIGAALLGVAVLIRHGRAGRKVALPFGPFVALGAVTVLLTLGPR